jgi:ABC-2 type transport system permease protein
VRGASALRDGPKYVAVAVSAGRQELADRGVLIGRAAFLGVILLIFSRLWEVVLAERTGLAIGRTELIWYLALTEWVVLSLPPLYLEIEGDVRTGDIAYRLTRPVSYVGERLAEAAGAMGVRLVSIGVAACGFAWLLAGGFPADPRGLVLALPVGLLASALGLTSHAAIGLFAFWIHDTSPVYWIWQKLAFVLGGLMFPLDVYPDWLHAGAELTPFAPMIYGVGSMAFGFDPSLALATAVRLLLWSGALVLLLAWIHRRALESIQVHGG